LRIVLITLCFLLLSTSVCSKAGEDWAQIDIDGRTRLRFDNFRSQSASSLNTAKQLGLEGLPDTYAQGMLRTDLKLATPSLSASATLTQFKIPGQKWASDAQLNELHASGSALGWYYTFGRKIVSWDVGWGFRPNDLIQQEARLVVSDSVIRGRPLVMIEKFYDDAALSVVAVNPGKDSRNFGGDEPALAARYFHHLGQVDLYGFVRWGARTSESVGVALSWVATESVEFHASWNSSRNMDTLCVNSVQGLVQDSPSKNCTVGRRQRILVGNTWSSTNNFTVIAEWWWDGSAPSKQTWREWHARNVNLSQMAEQSPLVGRLPIAANLAWQSNALLQTNLHRSNLLASISWAEGKYSYSFYKLWYPVDRGAIYTATLGWSDLRWSLSAGARYYGGARNSVASQLPTKSQVYFGGSLKF
jgi:hypothetical protein